MQTKKKPTKLSQVLKSEKSWTKGRLVSASGKRCLLGAAGKIGLSDDSIRQLAKICRALAPEKISTGHPLTLPGYVPYARAITDFNDAPDTSFADIQQVIRLMEADLCK